MNVACDDVLLQPNEGTPSYLKNEKYYSYVRRKSIKNSEQEEKNINRVKRFTSNIFHIVINNNENFAIKKTIINIKVTLLIIIIFFFFNSLSTSSYSIKPEAMKSLSLDKVKEEYDSNTNKTNEQISIFQMDRDDNSKSHRIY